MITSKKANIISETVIFLVLNALFFGMLFLFLADVGKGNDFVENVYSKKIALTIDSLKPGTEITLYLNELFDYAEKNNFYDPILTMDYLNHKVNVRVSRGPGHNYGYIIDLKDASISWDNLKKTITIKT